jgi:hypothetical protein
MTTTFADFVATRPDATLQQTEVLHHAEELVRHLKGDYRSSQIAYHQTAIARKGITDESFVSYHEKCLSEIRMGTYDYRMKFHIVESRKYLRIEQETGVNHDGSVTQKSIHAFIDKKTGEVYKAATWKSPAKHVRYNLLDAQSREKCFRNADWAGGYLYMR